MSLHLFKQEQYADKSQNVMPSAVKHLYLNTNPIIKD
jgi:hypothetical protein